MPKKAVFVCTNCGSQSPKWSGRCDQCESWGSLVEEALDKQNTAQTATIPETSKLDDIATKDTEARLASGSSEIDRVLGGGIVVGSTALLAGEPGIGKSTLLLQVATRIAAEHKVLYISGEESLQQVSMRAQRLQLQPEQLELVSSTDTDAIAALIDKGDYSLVIVDSIQTLSTGRLNSNPGSVSQITTSAHILQQAAKTQEAAVLMVGHVTKEGSIAGPKILEHLVDTVLHLEGEQFGGFKLLRSVKNRFGPTHEVGVFEMQDKGLVTVDNPSDRFLQERQPGPGSVVCATMEGTRSLLVEVQALVNASPFGYPKRTSVGFDTNRLNVLIAVLDRHAGVALADKDVYVNVVGGLRLQEPAADLAIALAICSAAQHQPIAGQRVCFGEIGLSGEVRSVSHMQSRIKEAQRLQFSGAIGPQSQAKFVESVPTMKQAVASAFQQTQ